MKISRHEKIIELITSHDISTQEELCTLLNELGYKSTQATISRDIKSLGLRKVANGTVQKYALPVSRQPDKEKYLRIINDGLQKLDQAANLVIIKTIPGMAMAVAAAVDELQMSQIVGSIAGDDTIMCACRSDQEAVSLINDFRTLLKDI